MVEEKIMNNDGLYCEMCKPHPLVKYQYLTTLKSNFLQFGNMFNFLLCKIKLLIYWVFQLIKMLSHSLKTQVANK